MNTAEDQQPVTPEQVAQAGLTGWRYADNALHSRWATGDFSAGAALTQQIAQVADRLNHHPDVDLRYPHLDVRTTSHDVGAVTSRDLDLAREVSALAARAGVSAADDD